MRSTKMFWQQDNAIADDFVNSFRRIKMFNGEL